MNLFLAISITLAMHLGAFAVSPAGLIACSVVTGGVGLGLIAVLALRCIRFPKRTLVDLDALSPDDLTTINAAVREAQQLIGVDSAGRLTESHVLSKGTFFVRHPAEGELVTFFVPTTDATILSLSPEDQRKIDEAATRMREGLRLDPTQPIDKRVSLDKRVSISGGTLFLQKSAEGELVTFFVPTGVLSFQDQKDIDASIKSVQSGLRMSPSDAPMSRSFSLSRGDFFLRREAGGSPLVTFFVPRAST